MFYNISVKMIEIQNTIEKIQAENFSLKRKLKSMQQKHKRKRKRENESMTKIFNEDQICFLENGSTMEWSNDTIQKSIETKFYCGNKGYEYLRESGYPLPSSHTLRRKMLGLQFDAGINAQTFEFLKNKTKNFANEDKHCMLVYDEMSITEGLQHDGNIDSIIGHNTIPLARSADSVKATKALVFLVCGTSTRWKFTCGYYFTGDSINAESFKSIIFDLIKKIESIGLFVNSFTSGGSNKSLWKYLVYQLVAKN